MAFQFPIFMLSGASPSDRSLTSSIVGPVEVSFLDFRLESGHFIRPSARVKGEDALISNNIATSCSLVDGSKKKKKVHKRGVQVRAFDETVHRESWVNWFREDSTSNKSFWMSSGTMRWWEHQVLVSTFTILVWMKMRTDNRRQKGKGHPRRPRFWMTKLSR